MVCWLKYVIFRFSHPKLVTIPNFAFIWRCLTPKWQYDTFYEYLMKTLSYRKINVIFRFPNHKLVSIPIFTFLRCCLTPKWRHVTFLWIFNEDVVLSKSESHIWISGYRISHHTKFDICLPIFDVSIPQMVWIDSMSYSLTSMVIFH